MCVCLYYVVWPASLNRQNSNQARITERVDTFRSSHPVTHSWPTVENLFGLTLGAIKLIFLFAKGVVPHNRRSPKSCLQFSSGVPLRGS